MPPPPPVLVDTNAVMEAVRTGCWAALANHFRLETVEQCRSEAATGNSLRPSYVPVSVVDLALLSAVHAVSDVERATLVLQCTIADGLDEGERDLWAHALGRPDAWLLCSPDKASIRAAVELGLHERLVSVEALARTAGVRPRPRLFEHHTQARLQEWRTAALLGTL